MMAIGRSLAYIFSGQTSISNIPVRACSDARLHDVLGVPANVVCLCVLYVAGLGSI